MKIIQSKDLSLPGVKVIKFGKFYDHRGYFTETYRKSDMAKEVGFDIVQMNESLSKKNVIRGLHFQWNPYMGKLVRTVKGHMVDLILDIRKNSPTYGKAIAYDMPVSLDFESESEWIWVPAGMAHGNFFKEVTMIEYLCSGEYSQGCEASISPASEDIDWSMCEPKLYEEIVALLKDDAVISDKDKQGLSLKQWENKKESDNFIYGEC